MPSKKTSRADKRLASAIADRIEDTLLAGDADFSNSDLKDAAQFLLEAARSRMPGDAAITVESVTGEVGKRLTRIAVINDDMPFLVDSVAAAISAHGLTIDRLAHPVAVTRRNGTGRLLSLPKTPATGDLRESLIYIETDRADARTRVRLRAALESTLGDVSAAVTDWPMLQQAMEADADRLELADSGQSEGAELLRWLSGGMLTQLGHMVRRRSGRQVGGIGICRNSTRSPLAAASYDRAFDWFESSDRLLPLIVKANKLSLVHRRVPLDLFIVPVIEKGRIEALSIHAGVWTSAAMSAPPDRVPRMREQLAGIMERLAFDPQGHDGKALVHALTALPHDLVIGFNDKELERSALIGMSLIDRPRPHLLLVRSPLERHLFAFVWLPRDALSTALRMQVQAMLEQAADAPVLDWSLQMDGKLVLIRFVLDIRDGDESTDEQDLQERLTAIVRGWPEAVEAELASREEPVRAAALAARFAEAFPLSYRMANGAAEAAIDIQRLRALPSQNANGVPPRGARLHSLESSAASELRLKLYQRRGLLELSDAVPMLENFGFRALGEVPTLLDQGDLGAIHDFQLDLPHGQDADALLERAGELDAAISAVVNGEAEDDPFNRLTTANGLAAREADWLRAWHRYLRQTGLPYGIMTVVAALQNAPGVTRGLIDLFIARHDPGFSEDRAGAEARAAKAIDEGLVKVAAINDDRLLRRYRALVEAILRTNAFALSLGGRSSDVALAFKIDSAAIPGLSKPVPWREMFVYSRRVEGIHLRAGPVARGGLRWSDRRDDFRTEVLGLMKAQCVKNAVIVPTGAKGGFYPKQLPDRASDREGWATEGRESYRIFIRSLLSLTDNIVDGKVVHPAHMVIRDGDDPYFVVAADKGTASFSDTANAIAEEQDFWLGDAFASGGTKGYDHKVMGITARGAWISVQRHFLELGVDVQRESVRVAGCGDMSGDVFGNGMLL
ncbi:MAG: NAD-glutamate dehydrogenase, partial [Novosphingobium sp.]|nr:NAD-glutamate dehydrogenase [Novosphingobium sp.]